MRLNYLLLSVVLLAVLIRIISANQSLWLDEATTALVARDYSCEDFFTGFVPADFHPPLYYIVVKIFTSLINNYSELALRMPSIIFGVSTAALVYKIGETLINKKVGLVAALLLATAPLHIYYSQEARMYAMAAFLAALAVYLYVKKKHLFFALALTAAFWADYMAIFIAPVFLLYAFYAQKKHLKRLIASLVGVFLLCLPMLVFLPSQLTLGFAASSTNWGAILGRTNLKNTLLIPVKFMIGRISIENTFIYVLVVAATGALMSWALLKTSKLAKKQLLLWLWLVVPVGTALVVGLFIPVVSYFRFLFVLPALYLLLSAGAYKNKILVFSLLVINLAFTSVYLFDSRFHREDWRGLVSYIEHTADESHKVIFVADSQMEAMKYYSRSMNFSGPTELGGNEREIWLMRYVWDIFDPSDEVRKNVEKMGYTMNEEYNFNGIVVFKYSNENRN